MIRAVHNSQKSPITTRRAEVDDLSEIALIYNQGIEDRIATFETAMRKGGDLKEWLDSGYPVVVGVLDADVVSFGVAHRYSMRDCYSGIGEFSVYVRRDRRGHGIGKRTMVGLIEECESAGLWKLVSRVFPENLSSRGMLRSLGFREVGIYRKHARLDGVWRDVIIVELLLGEAQEI